MKLRYYDVIIETAVARLRQSKHMMVSLETEVKVYDKIAATCYQFSVQGGCVSATSESDNDFVKLYSY
jgi:hypothetical protein